MGNIGRPSTGCALCRKRRVKCDEGKPGCRNCARLKKPCPGYRSPDYGSIRPTVFVSTPETSRHSSTESLVPNCYSAKTVSIESEESDTAQSDSVLELSKRRSQSPMSMGNLPQDVTEQAVWYSLSQLDVHSRILYGNETFSFLPDILSKVSRHSYLYAAMRAVGIVNLANRSPTVDMRNIVDFEYAKAVSGVNAALADHDQRLKDETLVAVWLLGIRELLANITGSNQCNLGGDSAQQTHIDGTLMLLRMRGEGQFTTPEGRHLYQLLLSSMHWKPLFASEEPSPEYLMLEAQIPKAVPVVPKASSRLRNFFHGVSKLRARIKNFVSICQTRLLDRDTLVGSYIKAALKLEEKVASWCDMREWMPQPVVDEEIRPNLERGLWAAGSPFRLHWFRSWNGFFHWNRYFVSKICLHAALIDALAQLDPSSLAETLSHGNLDRNSIVQVQTAALQETVRDFLGTLGYAFGDVDAHGHSQARPSRAVSEGADQEVRGINVPATLQVQPPLAFLIRLEYLGSGQREAMYLALQRLRAEFCLR
ncbi:hypothetical protein H2204_003368 [Knufia peltigerae]|uniref:Zn(2)-C6 fungal-type domain-containing protein n=1 Tax=Knufia peltigerae TaxID=1002370 RepID=A0AA39CZK0_9EURO|nr:hypothetical protein H2204_003368 [Knufia peltigerae]